ncbi:Retrovirus-related Pol polyprotein from transposon RE1 [Bienertia sinuspersici]
MFDTKWIIDSGATDYICCNLSMFDSYKVFDKSPNTITLANGKTVQVEHVENVIFGNGVVLKNVLHVLGVKFNLISTNKLCKDLCCTIVFTKDKCLIQGCSQKDLVVLGNMELGLYALAEDVGTNTTEAKVSVAASLEDAML